MRGQLGTVPGRRAAIRCGLRGVLSILLGALLSLGAINALRSARAAGDTRTLSFHHVHTGENLTVTYMHDGRYVPSALKKIDWLMRDWRKGKETHMDPHLIDLLWKVYHDVGATQPIQIICGYRSPATNAMLRVRSGGVAHFSQHILGKAIDFYIPGVPLSKLRAVGLELQRGGVGFYPTSGSPFVHMDVGSVRHWPSIPRTALIKLFPHGRTVHIPADGKPLAGYAQALTQIERRGNVPSPRSLAAARTAGLITGQQEQVAVRIDERRTQPLIAMVDSGKGNDYARPGAAPLKLASLHAPAPIAVRYRVPLPEARPRLVAVAAAPEPAPMVTASLSRQMVASRDVWGKVIADNRNWRNSDDMPSFEVAAAETTASAVATDGPTRQAHPMGASIPKLPREAVMIPATGNTTVAVMPPTASGGERWSNPWLRAAMLTPSARADLTTTRMGRTDLHWLGALLQKPARSVLMTFSADPQLGMGSDRFTGPAVKFLAIDDFTMPQTTASLQ